jgi:hypothetical protein
MPQFDLSQYTQQQYELVKSYLICASLGCVVLLTALYVAATTLWRKLKQKQNIDAIYQTTGDFAKPRPKPDAEFAVTVQPHDMPRLKMKEIHYCLEHDEP